MLRPEDLEREISEISSENQALAEKMQQVRSDFEHAREEEHRKILDLEQVRETMELARKDDRRKLVELESLNSTLETTLVSDRSKLLDLEARLSEIDSERNQARDKVRALENVLAETSTRLEKTDQQLKDLQVSSVEQVKQFTTSLSEASNRLESTDNQVRELENRLVNDRQDYLKSYQDMQQRFRKQDSRMNWTIMAAGFALLLGTVAGAVLIWDVQRNATVLSSVSRDIKTLMASMNGRLNVPHKPREEQQQALPAITAPDTRATVEETPASSTAAIDIPAPSDKAAISKATISKAVPNPYFLGSAFDRGRPTNREGIKQAKREDANAFFEENAKVEGVVSLPSGVQYRVVTAGSGKSPTLADKVVVAYVGTKLDGTIFDETYSDDESLTFSMEEVMPGWREVLLKMEEGAEFELYIPPNHTTKDGVRKRGMLGYEPNIYLVELLEVVKEGATDPAPPSD